MYTKNKEKLRVSADGRKLYPLANWNNNQHKLYYWYWKAQNGFFDAVNSDGDVEKAQLEVDRFARFIDIFDGYVDRCGIAYAPYPEYADMKEALVCYDLYH